jgi:DNA-binding MarR family transcriptional regulator
VILFAHGVAPAMAATSVLASAPESAQGPALHVRPIGHGSRFLEVADRRRRAPCPTPLTGAMRPRQGRDVDENQWLDLGEQVTWREFMAATRLLSDRIERQLQRNSGLTHAYYDILTRLSEAPDRTLRMSELAASLLSSRSRLSHAVARLEAAGWVRRTACDTDRRGSFAELTDEGLTMLRTAARGHVETVRTSLFDALNTEQQAALREISETLVGHLLATPASLLSPEP